MAVYKPTSQKQQTPEKKKSPLVPLLIAAGVLVIIGLIMLSVNKSQAKDPTLTAAPPTGVPGQFYRASPAKQARELQLRAKADAELAGIKASAH